MTITVEFDPPQPGDSREVFNNKAFDTVAKLNPWSQQANALALEVNNDAATAEAGAEIVNAVVNFRGAWDDLTGALSVPASCAHASGYWILLESVADVTAHEPGVSAVWAMYESDFARLSGADFTGPITVPAGASGAQVPRAQETYGPKNGQLAGMRNKIINGAFGINQREYASGAATTAGQYILDRWKVTGTGGVTFSTTANKTTVTIPSGQTIQQVIEGLNLQTGTYVLSWEGTAQGRIDGGSYGASGAVTASITGGTNTTIEFNSGTVANVQLELGTIATPFEHRHYGTELALCQRYLPVLGVFGGSLLSGMALGQCYDTASAIIVFNYQVRPRTSPTFVAVSAASDFQLWQASTAGVAPTGIALLSADMSSANLNVTGASGLVAGNVTCLTRNSANAKILFNGCEL